MTPAREAIASRREFLVGGALLATAAASGVLARTALPLEVRTAKLAEQVPAVIGPWRFAPGGNVPIPQGEGGGEEVYDQLISRHYQSDEQPAVMLLIAYGGAQSGSTQLHRPEVCYPAAGFRIFDRPDITLRLPGAQPVPARALTAVAQDRIEQILYWSRVGHDFPTNSIEQRWFVLRQTLTEGVPDGVLVRISTIESEHAEGLAVLRRFADALLVSGGSPLRRLLVDVA